MDLEIIILSEVRQKKTNVITYIQNLKKKKKSWHNINRLTGLVNEPEGKSGMEDRLGVWDWYVHTPIFKIEPTV